MKPRNILSIALLPLLMLFMQHCDDPLTELEKLPKATQSGKDTFGCLVNGKAWVSRFGGQAFYQTGTLGIDAGASNNVFSAIMSFHVFDLDLTTTTYQLSEKLNQADNEYARYYDHNTDCEYFTTDIYKGALTIKHLDKVNFIISGNFELEFFSVDCSKVLKVTDGRFDMHYAP